MNGYSMSLEGLSSEEIAAHEADLLEMVKKFDGSA
jgi:hypothetical protein